MKNNSALQTPIPRIPIPSMGTKDKDSTFNSILYKAVKNTPALQVPILLTTLGRLIKAAAEECTALYDQEEDAMGHRELLYREVMRSELVLDSVMCVSDAHGMPVLGGATLKNTPHEYVTSTDLGHALKLQGLGGTTYVTWLSRAHWRKRKRGRKGRTK